MPIQRAETDRIYGLTLPTIRKLDRVTQRVLREDYRRRPQRRTKNFPIARSFALLKVTDYDLDGTSGLFPGLLQRAEAEDLPGTFGDGDEVWLAFANCDHATLKPVVGLRLFGRFVGRLGEEEEERGVYLCDYPLPDLQRATLTQDLESNGSATATRVVDSAPLTVADWGPQIPPGKHLPSGSPVWVKLDCGVYYLVQAGSCPVKTEA